MKKLLFLFGLLGGWRHPPLTSAGGRCLHRPIDMKFKQFLKTVTASSSLILFIIFFCHEPVKSQSRAFSFSQLDSLQQIEKRKALVFVYTDWCSYCKAMEQKVFAAPEIQQQLKENYYWIALNAEEKSPISYHGRTFVFKASKGLHELAIELAKDKKQLAFPFLTILDPQNQISYQQEGFVNVAELRKVLVYFKR